jgi:hypothetical protein
MRNAQFDVYDASGCCRDETDCVPLGPRVVINICDVTGERRRLSQIEDRIITYSRALNQTLPRYFPVVAARAGLELLLAGDYLVECDMEAAGVASTPIQVTVKDAMHGQLAMLRMPAPFDQCLAYTER